MGDTPSHQTVTNRTEVDPVTQQWRQQIMGQGGALYNQGVPQYYPGSTVVPFSDATQQGLNYLQNQAQQGAPNLSAANSWVNQSAVELGPPLTRASAQGEPVPISKVSSDYLKRMRMFAVEYSGVEPDLMTIAKSVSGGVPLAGVIGKADIMDAPQPGGLGGTFAGSPLACAAGLAVLEVIKEEQLLQRANHIGKFMTSRLNGLQVRFPCIGEVRSLGAMVAIELVKNCSADQPDAELTKQLVQAAARKGLILLSCGIYGNVIRFLAPLTISDALLKEGFNLFEQALQEVASSTSGATTAAAG